MKLQGTWTYHYGKTSKPQAMKAGVFGVSDCKGDTRIEHEAKSLDDGKRWLSNWLEDAEFGDFEYKMPAETAVLVNCDGEKVEIVEAWYIPAGVKVKPTKAKATPELITRIERKLKA